MSLLGTIWSAAPLPALGNDRRSRKARAALAKKQRTAARLLCLAFAPHDAAQWLGMMPAKQLVVTLTRFHPPGKGVMDDDGLRATFKHVRDGIADFLGVDDSPRSGIQWRYSQSDSHALPWISVPENAKWVARFESVPLIKPLSDADGAALRRSWHRWLSRPIEPVRAVRDSAIQTDGEYTFNVRVEAPGTPDKAAKRIAETLAAIHVSAMPYEPGQFVVRVVLR